MAYQRQARTFSSANFDLTRRDVDVVPEEEERPAPIRPPSGFSTSVGGTVAMKRAEFGRPGAVRIVSR